jgi:hypothetical protein
MVLATGVQDGSINSVNFSSGGGVGFGNASINMTTRLAAKYNPGSRPVIFGTALFSTLGVIGGLFGLIVLLFTLKAKETPGIVYGCGFFFLIIGPALFWSKKFIKSSHERAVQAWEEKSAYANRAWVCLRCGHDWIP